MSMYMLQSAVLHQLYRLCCLYLRHQLLDANQQTVTEPSLNSGDVAGITPATQAGGRP